jgi:hypothetical protein
MHSIHVVGGAYEERCLRPQWHEVFGSAGRATSAIAAFGGPGLVALHCYANPWSDDILAARCSFEGSALNSTQVAQICSFSYDHGLAIPRIETPPTKYPSILVQADTVIRFGMLEGDAIVHAGQAVYDPQSAITPAVFQANGSTADRLAVVLNDREATSMTGLVGAEAEELAQAVRTLNAATIVVIKLGPLGALVLDESGVTRIPAYASDNVWKIGSGDIFVAHFGLRWMYEGKSAQESAMLASLATSQFCDSTGFPTPSNFNCLAASPVAPSARFLAGHQPMVYLAGPFFTLAQLWLIEQVKTNLLNFGLSVFSPYHDVGHGSADDVVELDLKGIRDCDILFAIGDGLDSGTIYEIGYARARDIPVIVYCENESSEDQKMMEGSGCILCTDYVSAIYKTLWAAISI